MKNLIPAILLGIFVLGLLPAASAKEPDPIPYRSAPIIPWARKTGEHRFRSPRNYDDTVKYYGKIFYRSPHIETKKIINTSTARAVHYKNKRPKGRWEGLNVYEHKGAAWIFVVFTDTELKKFAEDKKNGKLKEWSPSRRGSKKKPKKKKKRSG